jgi:hypothetical protein
MRSKLWVVVVLLLVAFLATAGAAQAKAPLTCEGSFYTDALMDHWEVALTGDVDGTMYVYGDPTREFFFPGKTEHFFETWIVFADDGGWFSGTDAGVWSFVTFKFRANGWVTEASPEWQFLVGHKFHEIGTTTDPFTGNPFSVSGDSKMFFAGP